MLSYETRIGTIDISKEYLSKLIGSAVTQCYGVVDMVPSGNRQKIFGIFSKKDYADKGIIIKETDGKISVEIHITVLYGMNISAIAKSIVNKVRFAIDENVGISVDKINVKVDGIKE